MSDITIKTSAHIAAAIAGGSIGVAHGFMTKGEELEDQGASFVKQATGSAGQGIMHGAYGAAIGVGAASTAIALKKILGK